MIRAFVVSSRDYCNAGVWVSSGHNSLVTLADFLTIASPSLSQHIFHLADKISHSLMSFRQATVLCLSKCFYRDTPQAVDLDQSYVRPLLSHMPFCLLMFWQQFCVKTTINNFFYIVSLVLPCFLSSGQIHGHNWLFTLKQHKAWGRSCKGNTETWQMLPILINNLLCSLSFWFCICSIFSLTVQFNTIFSSVSFLYLFFYFYVLPSCVNSLL